ncbi:Uncharacterized membrane protein YccC [Rhizobiales bacterium GAS188]|nr:Uncharacterized membrane protein YccC [Rhizobiales bacterium GAS188]
MMRGTLRNPGADLARLPIGLDLRAISIVEGLRAAIACGAVILVNEWVQWPPLFFMALAANLTCFCDVGGPIRQRLFILLAFTLIGALAWCGFGLLRPAGLAVVVPLACAAIFCCSFARVWGVPATAVGNVLVVAIVLSLDEPLSLGGAAVIGAMFIAGGLWAILLALLLWRLHPYQPARAAVANVWRLLAALAGDLRSLAVSKRTPAADWDAHARSHRRAVREAVERARDVVMELVRGRGALSERGGQALIRLEAGDQIFGALIALSDLLEDADAPDRRQNGARMLRILQATLGTLSRAILTERVLDLSRIERAIDALLVSAAGDPALQPLGEAIAERLRIAVRLSTPGGHDAGETLAGEPTQPSSDRFLGPIRANLTWKSAILRHAMRAAVIAAPALILTLMVEGAFTHWLTITVVLTLQPYYAATWQRALERIGGTMLGGLIGAVLVHFAQTPVALAALMFPLCIIGFSARQVSYGAFIACLMPQLIVLVELVNPGHSSIEIIEMRALFTVIGGAIAVAGCFVLWPSWEPDRLRQELRSTLKAHGGYAKAIIAEILGEGSEKATEGARRAAGVASNNFETSLSRAIQEPGRGDRDKLEAAMVADATLRRAAGRLSALRHANYAHGEIDAKSWRAWGDWIADAFTRLAQGEKPMAPRPPKVELESLGRIARQIELLEAVLRRFW